MLYITFFGLLSAAAIAGAFVLDDSPWRWMLLWPALNGLVLASAHALNRPEFVMGKGRRGWMRLFCAINLPWLALTWLVALLARHVSKEHVNDRVGDTNIWIGRRPSEAEAAAFDHVFDLTAEFPRCQGSRFRCVPNIDGMPLADHQPLALPLDGRVLVHCAQGHGRSATWLALQLVHNEICSDLDAALAMIARSRPRARPARAQLQQLRARTAAPEDLGQRG